MAGSGRYAISCRKSVKEDVKLLLILRMISILRLLNQLRRQTERNIHMHRVYRNRSRT